MMPIYVAVLDYSNVPTFVVTKPHMRLSETPDISKIWKSLAMVESKTFLYTNAIAV